MNRNTSLFPLALIHTTEAQANNNPVSEEERLVTEALDVLEATGDLQRSNRMDITELLNPVAESSHVFDAGNKDIFQAVMHTKAAQESSKSDEVSADGNNDCDEPTEPPPTWKEALQAMMVLRRYANEMDDSLVHKVEAVLGSFGRMTQVHEVKSMKDKKLTKYFTRK